jgi:hypothetical protein
VDRWFLPAGAYPEEIYDASVIPPSLLDFAPTLTVQPDGVMITSQFGMQYGARYFADPVQDTGRTNPLGAIKPVTRIALTCCLRLPHPVSMYKLRDGVASWEEAKRRKRIYIPNAQLWLCAPNAIYDLQQSDVTADGYVPLRGCLGSTTLPAVLRDDRPFLARYYELAWRWYLSPRKRMHVAMKFCGLMPFTYSSSGGAPYASTGLYPQLGQYVTEIASNGITYPVGTVVTSVLYDHQLGTTTWETDYFDLEFR